MHINNNVRSVGNSLAEICEESDDAGRIAATEAQLDDSAKAKLYVHSATAPIDSIGKLIE